MTIHGFTIVAPTVDDVEALDAMWSQSRLDTYPNDDFGISREWVEARVGPERKKERIKRRREQILASKNNPDMLWRVAKDKNGMIIGVIAPHRDAGVNELGQFMSIKTIMVQGLPTRS